MKTRMYDGVTTWNPFKGCEFDCTYCTPTFKLQAKRQKHSCNDCYQYVPHEHPERLNQIPSTETIFVCGNADISFCDPAYTEKIINSINKHNKSKPGKTFYFQSKRPEYFEPFLDRFPDNVILLTTLETNRDQGYDKISKAPKPSERFGQLRSLKYLRKVVTVEPVMDFDLDIFSGWITSLEPEYVWLGYNSRPKQIDIPEPSKDKVKKLVEILESKNIDIRFKDMRNYKQQCS
jgi:uncharacterized Fe-S cluster-containing radical SAM superfamily protein